MDYWVEHAEIALSEAGLPAATPDQLQTIAGVIESAHEFYGQSMGHDVASVNFRAEQERQQAEALRAVEKEKDEAIERANKMLKDARWERDQARFAAQDARRKLAELECQL